MPKTDAFDDEEVERFVERLPRSLTFTAMASACLEQFGPERAWSRSKIIRYWQATHPIRKGRASRLDLDPEVRDFVEDLLGRVTIESLVTRCRERFGTERTPGKSSIHLHWLRMRRTHGAGKLRGNYR